MNKYNKRALVKLINNNQGIGMNIFSCILYFREGSFRIMVQRSYFINPILSLTDKYLKFPRKICFKFQQGSLSILLNYVVIQPKFLKLILFHPLQWLNHKLIIINLLNMNCFAKVGLSLVVCLFVQAVLIATFLSKDQLNIQLHGYIFSAVLAVLISASLAIQNLIAFYNKRFVIDNLIAQSKNLPDLNIQVVGYREDPNLFRSCLLSIKNQDYPNVRRIIVAVDGNELDDNEMEKIFLSIFPNGKLIRLQDPLHILEDSDKQQFYNCINSLTVPLCITQPHSGKREIMYTAFCASHSQAQLTLVTQSDCILETNAASQLVKVINGHDNYRARIIEQGQNIKQCGAVAGRVNIYNQQNLLTFITALRTWIYNDVQRSSDSAFGAVSHVHGALGIYKNKFIKEVLQDWLDQQFLGQKCTFGEDRHLPNLLLERNLSIYYTPYASCQTDAPAELTRWIIQQTRHQKALYRQFFCSMGLFCLNPLWNTFKVIKQISRFLFLLVILAYLETLTFNGLVTALALLMLSGISSALIACLRTRNLKFIFYAFNIITYTLLSIPCKVFGLITLWNNDWGTSYRLKRINNITKSLHAYLWALFFLAFLIYLFISFIVTESTSIKPQVAVTAACACAFLILTFLVWLIFKSSQLREQFKQRLIQSQQVLQIKSQVLVKQIKERQREAKHSFFISQFSTEYKLPNEHN